MPIRVGEVTVVSAVRGVLRVLQDLGTGGTGALDGRIHRLGCVDNVAEAETAIVRCDGVSDVRGEIKDRKQREQQAVTDLVEDDLFQVQNWLPAETLAVERTADLQFGHADRDDLHLLPHIFRTLQLAVTGKKVVLDVRMLHIGSSIARRTTAVSQMSAIEAEKVRKYGWAIQGVGGDRCACCPGGIARERSKLFAYTIGMFGIGHPEFLIFPKRLEDAQRALNAIAHRVHCHGEQFISGQVVDFDAWRHRATIEDVPNPGEIVFTANRFYQRPNEASVPVLQLTLDDMGGKFPWEEGCSWTARQQPRPGEFKA